MGRFVICSRLRLFAVRRERCSARTRRSAPWSSARNCRPSRRSATSETTFGNYDRVTQKLNVTGPIIDDKLAYRVTLYYDRGNGWINNQFNSQQLLDNNRWAFAASSIMSATILRTG